MYFVDSDVSMGITQCMEHMTGLGHKNIAFLHQGDETFGYSIRAIDSYLAACGDSKITPILQPCGLSAASGRTAFSTVLDRAPETSAVIVWNDGAAWGALGEAEERGMRVPEDLSLIYFNATSMSLFSSRQPTYVDIRPEMIATTAAQMMIDILHGIVPQEPQVLITPNFVIGGNTGPNINL